MLRYWTKAPLELRSVFDRTKTMGDRTYLIYEEERLSYAEHHAQVVKLAWALREDYGIAPRERVAIAMRNYPEFVMTLWAVIAIGAVAVPLNAWWQKDELSFGLRDSGARLLVADATRLERLGDKATRHLPCVVVRGPATNGTREFAALFERHAPEALPPCNIEPDNPATLFYTSGTTGRPKGVLGTHRNLCSTIWTSLFGLKVAKVADGDPLSGPDDQKAVLITAPLFHVIACFSGVVVMTYAASTSRSYACADASTAASLIERERVSSVTAVHTVISQLCDIATRGQHRLASLERVSIGGAPVPPALIERTQRLFPGVMLGTGWGMTETASPSTHLFGEAFVNRPACVGPPSPVCDLRIVDEQGRTLPTGRRGELWVRGPNVIARYLINSRASAEAFVDGWLKTGDVGWLDGDGFLYLVDRLKDMIIRGGENIHCVEVENAILAFDGVAECAVIGLPHPELGEEVAAVLVTSTGEPADIDRLRAHLESRLAYFKIPTRYRCTTLALPRNAGGKVLKSALKDAFTD